MARPREESRRFTAESHVETDRHVPRFSTTLYLERHLGGSWKWSEEYQEMQGTFSFHIARHLNHFLSKYSIAAMGRGNGDMMHLILPASSYSLLRQGIENGNILDLHGQPLKNTKKPLAKQISAQLKQGPSR